MYVFRITPACAGNSPRLNKKRRQRWDHPRVCGEQKGAFCHLKPPHGSPPRVRGTAKLKFFRLIFQRITPACAGNSSLPQGLSLLPRDHPRVCGEQRHHQGYRHHLWGSPPRVRGTVYRPHETKPMRRITPACAGNSSPRFPGPPGPRDHPRVCGEQFSGTLNGVSGSGSPPRVRGTA